MTTERPNIFRLYEENIGMLTPMIAEELLDAEQVYPKQWIQDAMREAVLNGAHSWRYVEAILKRWQREGRKHKPSPPRTGKARKVSASEFFERWLEG